MEPQVTRYTFRFEVRGTIADCSGRVILDDAGLRKLQVWMRSPEQANILLEVTGCKDEETLWKLFRKVCDYRGVRVIQYRVRLPVIGKWGPVPFGAGHSSAPRDSTAS